jgi:DNA-binding NarL/FixJ family response regulator
MISARTTNPGMEVVAQAANGREAVDLACMHVPDVVVLDVQMPVMSGQVALRKLLDLRPPPKVVIVTVFADESHVCLWSRSLRPTTRPCPFWNKTARWTSFAARY